MRAALAVEWLKLRRSRVVLVATGVLLIVPGLLGTAILAAAHRSGGDPMSAKAAALITGEGWAGYVSATGQILATGGAVGAGIVTAWVFGREFADRTVISLYASATPRATVAAAKHLVVAAWVAVVAALTPPSLLLIGLLSGLGGPDRDAVSGVARLGLLAALTGLVALAVALFASVGRGYLAGVGGLILLIVLAQVAVIGGVGGWIPWSVPGLWAISGPGTGLPALPAARLLLVPLSALATAAGTLAWWRRAELR